MATELHEQGNQVRSYMDQPEKEKTFEYLSGGTGIQAVAGLGTLVLAILGLVGILPIYLTSIAVIIAGVALLFGGSGIASRIRQMRSQMSNEAKFAELGGGMSAELLGGVGAIVLGILSLIGMLSAVLLPVAAIVLGGSLLIGATATSLLNDFAAFGGGARSEADMWMREAVASAAGAQVLVGVASITLGILSLAHFAWLPLTLVALLCVGASTLLSGATLAARLQSVLHHHTSHW
jgi:hypothetical protein